MYFGVLTFSAGAVIPNRINNHNKSKQCDRSLSMRTLSQFPYRRHPETETLRCPAFPICAHIKPANDSGHCQSQSYIKNAHRHSVHPPTSNQVSGDADGESVVCVDGVPLNQSLTHIASSQCKGQRRNSRGRSKSTFSPVFPCSQPHPPRTLLSFISLSPFNVLIHCN